MQDRIPRAAGLDPPDHLPPDGTTYEFGGKPYVVGSNVSVNRFTTQPTDDSQHMRDTSPGQKVLTLSAGHLLRAVSPRLRREHALVRGTLARTARHRPRTLAGRHEARPARATTRREGASSATSGADPGDGDSDQEPPSERPCAAPWCSHPVYGPPQKKYCGTEHCDRARAEERQRQTRLRNVDLVESERRAALENARLAGMIGRHAFAPAEEHSLSFLWGTRWSPTPILDVDNGDPGEFDARAAWIWCRCDGHRIDDGDGGCFRCGHWRQAVAA